MDFGALISTFSLGLILAAACWLAARGRFWWPVLLAVVVTLAVRLPQAPVPVFNVDEAINAAIAVRLQEGAVLYDGAWDHKPPLSFYLYKLIFDLFGRWNMTAVHVVGSGLYAAALVLTGMVGRRLLARPARPWGALLLALYGLLYYRWDFLATNHESAGVPFLLLGVLLLWKGLDLPVTPRGTFIPWHRRRRIWLALAGVSGMIAGLFREACAIGAVVSAVFLLLRPWLRGADPADADGGPGSGADDPRREHATADATVRPREAWGDFAALAAGALLVVAVFVAWLTAHGLLENAWFLMIVHNLRYRAAGRHGWSLFVHTFSTVLLFIAYAPALWISTLIGFVALIGRCLRPLFRRVPAERESVFLLLWLLGAGFFVLQGGRLHGHYFVPFYPPMMLSTAGFLASLRWPVRWGRRPLVGTGTSGGRPRLGAELGVVLLSAVLLLGLIPYHRVQAPGHARCVERFVLGRRSVPVVFKDIMITRDHHTAAMAIRSTTSPEESVFVWGFCPQLYVLGKVRPATRFTFTAILSGKTVEGGMIESEPRAWNLLKEDLDRERPALVVDASSMFLPDVPLEQFPEFYKWLRQRYRPLGELEGCRFYERVGRLPSKRPAAPKPATP